MNTTNSIQSLLNEVKSSSFSEIRQQLGTLGGRCVELISKLSSHVIKNRVVIAKALIIGTVISLILSELVKFVSKKNDGIKDDSVKPISHEVKIF